MLPAMRRESYLDHLASVPLFSACTKRELIEVALVADEREADLGEDLTAEGRAGREFFVLTEGHVAVRRKGRKLAELGPGDWFGEIALMTFKPRSATVTATSPVRLLVISDRSFRYVVETTPRIALRVLANVAQRLEREPI